MHEYIKKIKNEIPVSEFIVTFMYETKKGYYREQQRRVYAFNTGQARAIFADWIKTVRTMFNGKILNIEETGKIINLSV